MSMRMVIDHDPRSVPLGLRTRTRVVVLIARVLARRSPTRIRSTLERLRRGARPATPQQTAAARAAVTAVSLACAGREGCLPRSLATTLLCRTQGTWPTWCVGIRRLPPFCAHAWVEADGTMIGEDYPADYFRTFFTVPAAEQVN